MLWKSLAKWSLFKSRNLHMWRKSTPLWTTYLAIWVSFLLIKRRLLLNWKNWESRGELNFEKRLWWGKNLFKGMFNLYHPLILHSNLTLNKICKMHQTPNRWTFIHLFVMFAKNSTNKSILSTTNTVLLALNREKWKETKLLISRDSQLWWLGQE